MTRGGNLAVVVIAACMIPVSLWSVALVSRVAMHAADATTEDILDEPVTILPYETSGSIEIDRLDADRWAQIARKFLPDRPVPEVSFLLHHLLNWGLQARFPEAPGALSGPMMISILLSGKSHPLYLPAANLLYRGPDGLPRLAREGEVGSESHPHQILAALAELGVPSHEIIRSGSESASLGELVRAARADFHLHDEIDWTAIALARYAPTSGRWTNRWGRSFRFDDVAKHLLSRPLGSGSCGGTHMLQALAVLLRVDSVHRILSDSVRQSVRDRLADAIARLESNQRSAGFWTPDWPFRLSDPGTEQHDRFFFDDVELVQVTGHHLEWNEITPPDLSIEPESRRKAIEWCIAALERVSHVSDNELCPYSHCFRLARRAAALQQDPD